MTEGSLILALPTVCAVAHLDASLRWHDGGAPPRLLSFRRAVTLIVFAKEPPCALLRTWMPAFAGMTEGHLTPLRQAPPCRYPAILRLR